MRLTAVAAQPSIRCLRDQASFIRPYAISTVGLVTIALSSRRAPTVQPSPPLPRPVAAVPSVGYSHWLREARRGREPKVVSYCLVRDTALSSNCPPMSIFRCSVPTFPPSPSSTEPPLFTSIHELCSVEAGGALKAIATYP